MARLLTGAPLTPGYCLVTGISSPTGSASESATVEVINPTAPLPLRFGPPPEPAGQASLANAPWSVASTDPQLGGPLRFETCNTLNHTQFSSVNSTLQFNTKAQQINPAFMLPRRIVRRATCSWPSG